MDKETEIIRELDEKTYPSGIGKLLHMMKWSRQEISKAVRDLSRLKKTATLAHMKAMKRVMKNKVATPEDRLLLNPNAEWDGSSEFEVSGQIDSDF